MIDYSMVKCKLMEPRIGTDYTSSERSEIHGTRKYTKNYNKLHLGEQGSLKSKLNPRKQSRAPSSVYKKKKRARNNRPTP